MQSASANGSDPLQHTKRGETLLSLQTIVGRTIAALTVATGILSAEKAPNMTQIAISVERRLLFNADYLPEVVDRECSFNGSRIVPKAINFLSFVLSSLLPFSPFTISLFVLLTFHYKNNA